MKELTPEKAIEYLEKMGVTTLNHETVRSYEEYMIAMETAELAK